MRLAVRILLLAAGLALSGPALAQAPGYIQQYNAVCDPKSPTHCAAPDASGNFPITGTISASSSERSTAAAPTYGEGTDNPLSGNLTGDLRVIAKQSGSWLVGLSAGSAVIGHVITDTGSTTAVTGSVTVVQPTGTNLHVVADSGSTTVVTGSVAVTQSGTWSGLRVVGNAGAAFDAAVSAGSAPANMIVGGALYNSTEIAPTTGQSFALQGDSKGRLRMVIGDGAANSRFANVNASSQLSVSVDNNPVLGAGSAVIGHVITDTGSTTAVTGNVTVIQGTGTNLHVVTDATSTTAVTQATGTNLHTVTDATSVTAATLSAETTKVIGTARIIGNGGATLDSTVGAGTAPANQVVAGALYNSTEISPTTGQAFALQADSKGRLRNVIMDAAGNTRGANVDANNNLNVGQATAANLNATVVQGTAANLKAEAVGNVTPADGAALGTTSIRGYSLVAAYNGSTVDMFRGAANSLNSTGTGLGTAQEVLQCDDTSPTAITENSFGNARMDCATHAQVVTIVPSATVGGTTLFTLTAANTTNATNIKASAGQLYSLSGYTISATAAWLSLYNNAGTPTCGTSIIQQYLIPGSTTGAGFNIDFAAPKGFATGIAFCLTTGIAGTGAVAASSYVVNADYK